MLPVAPARDRAAAELAEARLERVAARLERREDVGQALAAGVVEVRGELDVVAQRVARRAKNSRTCSGLAIPVVSPKPTSWAPASRSRAAISSTRSGATWPS